MSTRSDIIAKRADGRWASIYCHSDGYPKHNGRILDEHYADAARVAALIALGDLSLLGPEIGVKHPFEPRAAKLGSGDVVKAYEEYRAKYGRMCRAYGRDRGDKGTAATIGATLQAVWPDERTWSEWVYVWDGNRWLVAEAHEGTQALQPLADVLAAIKARAA